MVEDRKIVIQPVVMNINGFDLLLGNDALRQLRKIQIDYQANEAKMELGKDDLNVVEAPLEVGKVRNRKSRCIPAYSMISVAVDMPAMPIPHTRLLEPSAKVMGDKGISFSRLIIPVETDPLEKIYVPLVNFSNKKQWVPKCIILGTVVPITTPVINVANPVHL
jgi:hypothetical protein